MRRILTGLFTLAIAAIATAASAQTSPKPAQIIVNNAPAGINIDIFLDAGKVQTAVVNQQGSTAFELDFLSLGKPQGQVYIETCRDGQRIRIVADGTMVADEDGCNRKPVGVLFTFTCTKKITLNFAAAKGSFAGCGTFLTRKEVLYPTLVAIGGGLISIAGGGDSTPTSSVALAPSITSTIANIPVTQNVSSPPVTTTPPVTPPSSTVPSPDGRWSITSCLVGSDPGGHNGTLRFCSQNSAMTISASNGGMSITASIIWVLVSGSYNTSSGTFDLSRTGPLSGTSFANVDFRTTGTIDRNGTSINLTITMGGGGLPGTQAITYIVVLTRA